MSRVSYAVTRDRHAQEEEPVLLRLLEGPASVGTLDYDLATRIHKRARFICRRLRAAEQIVGNGATPPVYSLTDAGRARAEQIAADRRGARAA